MYIKPYYFMAVFCVYSCKSVNGQTDYGRTKLLVLSILIPITFAIKFFYDRANERKASQLQKTINTTPVIPLDFVKHYKRSKKVIRYIVFVTLVPVLFSFIIGLASAFVLFLLFLFAAFVLYHKEREENMSLYSDVFIFSEKIILKRPSSNDVEEIRYVDIKDISINKDESTMESELVIWYNDYCLTVSVDYQSFDKGEELKKLLFTKLKVG